MVKWLLLSSFGSLMEDSGNWTRQIVIGLMAGMDGVVFGLKRAK